ncbi:MAG: HAD family hydrolase [Rhodanobacter sp.]
MLSNPRPSPHAAASAPVMFLVDVDNTLFDNDRFTDDLTVQLDQCFGETERKRYWALYEALRDEMGYADYLGTLQRFRLGLESDPALLSMSAYLLNYPFADHLYPQALAAITHLQTLGSAAILSDGDIVFQPHKVICSGLWQAFHANVLIYTHKQHMLEPMQQRYPAAHYVIVDDKPNLLDAMKQVLGERLTTVFVDQGHYAAAASEELRTGADMRIACIADLREHKLDDFLHAASPSTASAD